MTDPRWPLLAGPSLLVLTTPEPLGPPPGHGARRIEQVVREVVSALTNAGRAQLQAETVHSEGIAGVIGHVLRPQAGS